MLPQIVISLSWQHYPVHMQPAMKTKWQAAMEGPIMTCQRQHQSTQLCQMEHQVTQCPNLMYTTVW